MCDNSANVVALMLCAKFLLAHPKCLNVPVLLVFNTCEEGLGNLKGVRQLMESHSKQIAELVSFDLEYTALINRAVGSERWKIQMETCGGHSYSAFGNPNAVAKLSELVCRLYSQTIPQVPGTKTTYNVGTVSGGTSVNTIAQSAWMTYEYRSDDHACLQQMRSSFFAAVQQFKHPDVKITVESLGERPCGNAVPEETHARLLKRCADAIQQFTGTTPALCSASTDSNMPLSMGIPATTFGLCRGTGFHTREEYVETDSLQTGLCIALSVILQQ